MIMLRSITIVFLLTGMYHTSFAQQYFNVRKPMHSTNTAFSSVLPKDGKYYVTGMCIDSSVMNMGFYGGIKFAIFDSTGVVLRDTFYNKQDKDLGPWFNNLAVLEDGSFILAAFSDNDTGHALIVRMDSMGHVLWEKEYYKPVFPANTWYRPTDLKPTGTGEWLLLTYFGYGNNQYDFMLTKLDQYFEVIWHKPYGNPYFPDLGFKLLVEEDGYLITGAETNQEYYWRAKMIKVDTTGELKWQWTSPNNVLTNVIKDVIRTQDGGYVYCGQGDGYEDNDQISEVHWKGWIEKLDSNRNPVWHVITSPFHSNTEHNEQTVLNELPDGSIMVAGVDFKETISDSLLTANYGSLMKISSNGDVIWQRLYSSHIYKGIHQVIDMKQTPDGGFVLVGQARSYGNDNNTVYPVQQGWIVKVDSNGCESLNYCNPTGVAAVEPASSEIRVYPNPATDVLYIETELAGSSIIITDISGRTIHTKRLQNKKESIDLQHYAPGMYLYRITASGEVKGVGKVVKQ